MNKILIYIFLFFFLLPLGASAQIDINMDINEMLQNVNSKKTKPKKAKKGEVPFEIPLIDAFTPIESDMKPEEDYSIGALSFNWGDPVANPQIRRNTANNLFGQVRFNTDGSKRWHQGFDYYAPIGTPVLSVGKGVIESVGNSASYGKYVQIKHARGRRTYYSFYAHLSGICVKSGQVVQLGTVIGRSGITGNASNLRGEDEHLHFEYRIVPQSGRGHQADPNAIVKTKFYSADPRNPNQSQVGVLKRNADE